MSTLPISIQHCKRCPSHCILGEIIGVCTDGKGRIQKYLILNIIIYVENPKKLTKKSVELINEFSNIVGYEVDMKKINCVSTHKRQTIRCFIKLYLQ